jgi:hypothetical protein
LPHSRQNVFRRGVINPQNGHILCDRTSRARGVNIASSFPHQSAMKASRRRARLRKGRSTGSIHLPLLFLLLVSELFCHGNKRQELSRNSRYFVSSSVNNDMLTRTILSRIAHIAGTVWATFMKIDQSVLRAVSY